MKTIYIILFFVLSLPFQGYTKTILISDIDDTIKESKILGRSSGASRAFQSIAFWQMAEIYQFISKKGISIHYVSNAPEILMKISHQNFLRKRKFPTGALHLRGLEDINDFKIKKITKLIESEKPERVILVGDNGEKDIPYYRTIEENFAERGIEFLTFIRVAYLFDIGRPLLQNQFPFVTASEIAIVLSSEKIIDINEALNLIQQSVMASNDDLHLPDWVDC